MHDHTRDPCPYSIVNDLGIGFSMGAIGGVFWHGFKACKNSPRGERLKGAISTIKIRAPTLGGNFAVWSGLFNTSDCLITAVRKKDDSWNQILAGAATGAILSTRSGPKVMLISAMMGGTFLAVMEGIGSLIGRMNSSQYQPRAPILPEDFGATQNKAAV